MKIKYKSWIESGTVDLTFIVATQEYLVRNDEWLPIGQVKREALTPLDRNRISEEYPKLTELFETLWTDEVVSDFEDNLMKAKTM